MTALHRLVVVDVDDFAKTRLEWQPLKRLRRVRLTGILHDGDAAADRLTCLDLRFHRDGLNHAILRRDGLQVRLSDGLEQVAQEEHAEMCITDQFLLIKAVQSAEEPVLSLVRLDAQREIRLRQHDAVERVSGSLRLLRSCEAHVSRTSRVGHLLLLHKDGERLLLRKKLHDIRLSESPG